MQPNVDRSQIVRMRQQSTCIRSIKEQFPFLSVQRATHFPEIKQSERTHNSMCEQYRGLVKLVMQSLLTVMFRIDNIETFQALYALGEG
jgi:hypothetical protein